MLCGAGMTSSSNMMGNAIFIIAMQPTFFNEVGAFMVMPRGGSNAGRPHSFCLLKKEP